MAPHTKAEHSARTSRTTPKDFFLWLGAILSLYGTITAFFALIFTYINIAFPDPLAYYGDPYGSGARVAMATLIVLVPVLLGCLMTIRRDIVHTPGKADIWVRRWALVFTIFLASATAAITLITLLTTFLGGELSARFALKALIVLLVAVCTGLHFIADLRGFWTLHRRKTNMIGAAVGALAVMTIVAGFFIIGSPSHIRDLRTDQERVSDLQTIQYAITNHYQQKRVLPAELDLLNDPLTGTTIPTDPITGARYEYLVVDSTTFTICSTFSTESEDTKGQGEYAFADYSGLRAPDGDLSFTHGVGRTCFTRTIDPDKYPPLSPQSL
jgi:uncharacterized membrane protein